MSDAVTELLHLVEEIERRLGQDDWDDAIAAAVRAPGGQPDGDEAAALLARAEACREALQAEMRRTNEALHELHRRRAAATSYSTA